MQIYNIVMRNKCGCLTCEFVQLRFHLLSSTIFVLGVNQMLSSILRFVLVELVEVR